jgi:NADPH:quinone reductase-like Zn-dependent oxidoreductase
MGDEIDMIAVWMQILLKGVADGWVRPHVDKSFPLAQAGEAQTYLEERKNTGKVVLTV